MATVVIRCACGRELPQPIGVTLIDIAQLASWLATSPRHVRRLVEERRVPYIKVGHYIRFDPMEIRGWIEEQSVSVTADREDQGPIWLRSPEAVRARGRSAGDRGQVPTKSSGQPWVGGR